MTRIDTDKDGKTGTRHLTAKHAKYTKIGEEEAAENAEHAEWAERRGEDGTERRTWKLDRKMGRQKDGTRGR